jgi:hypothetical protein
MKFILLLTAVLPLVSWSNLRAGELAQLALQPVLWLSFA